MASSNYTFITIDAKFQLAAKPFLELKEVQAIWHPGAQGWMMETTQVSSMKAFLAALPEILVNDGKSVITKGKATVHYLGVVEKKLLALLMGTETGDTSTNYTERIIDMERKSVKLVDVEEKKAYILNRLDVERRYLLNKGVELAAGDLVRYIEEKDEDHFNDSTSIYTGTELITLVNGLFNVSILPRQFTSPNPYPINYWTGLLHAETDMAGQEGGINVWLSPEVKLTYVSNPEPIGSSIRPNECDDNIITMPTSAMQFTHQGQVYLIYFPSYEGKAAPTEEQVRARLVNPRTMYNAWSDTKMLSI